MASIKKRTTNRGEARYDVRWRVNGHPVEKAFRKSADAEVFKRKVEAAEVVGISVDLRSGSEPFAEYAERWLATRRRRDGAALAVRTRDLYRSLFDCHLLPAFGTTPLAKVTRDDVRSWWATTADKVSPTVAARCYRVLAAIYATALEDGKVQATPCTVKGGGQEHTAERPLLGPAQVVDVAERIDPRYRALILLAGLGGLRLGELLYLQRKHVDLLHRTVTVEGQLVDRSNGERIRTQPKSKAGRRVVSIDPMTTAALEVQLSTWSAPGPEGDVFTAETGRAPTRTTLGRHWRKAARSAGLPEGVHFHDLRHAAGTLAAQVGATTKELMSRIGHASPQAALRYQHAAEERDQVVADRIGALIASTAAPTAPVVPLDQGSRGSAAGWGAAADSAAG